jgi:hypothetical protein
VSESRVRACRFQGREDRGRGRPHDTINALLFRDFFYRVTVTNFSNTAYTLVGSDPLCDSGNFAFEAPGEFSTPQTLASLGTDVYYCEIDGSRGRACRVTANPGPRERRA